MMMSWCLMSSDVIWHIRDKLWPMLKHGSIKSTYVRCMRVLAVTCHLHFWQNDRDFLRATAVTRGWNGYRNKSQHRKSTLEKKILPPFQQGFEPATFQSRVRCSNHWAIPAPDWLIDWLMIAYIALFSALLSRLAALVCGSAWVTSFYSAFFEYPPKWCTYSAGMAGATWNCSRLGASPVYTIQPCTMSLHAKPHT